jgi:hypothetical protein
VCGNKLYIAEENDPDRFADKIIEAANTKMRAPDAFFEYYDWRKNIEAFIGKLYEI